MSTTILDNLDGVSVTLYAKGADNGGGMAIQLTVNTGYTQITPHVARRIAAALMNAAYKIERK